MTRLNSKTKTLTRSSTRKNSKTESRGRSAPLPYKAPPADTKQAHVLSMLRSATGATVASITAATDWQPHSVRSFLAGVVRKKLGLNLVSEQTDKGRAYRIKDGRAGTAAVDRSKQVA